MFADRTLAMTGSAILFCGSVISLIASLMLPYTDHPQFVVESFSLILLSIISVVLTWLRLFKAQWLIVFSTAAIFFQCMTSTIISSLSIDPAYINDSKLSDFVIERSVNHLSELFQHHLGWPVIFCGLILLLQVAWNVKGKLFDITPRNDGSGIPVFSSSASDVINELVEAPKWPLAYGTILILTGIIVLFAGNEISLIRKLIGALISELGFAFFIAFVIGITIEMKSHAERDRQISRGIISYIYGVSLDDNMFLTAEEYIFKTPFYREDLEVSYDFIRRNNGKFLLKYTVSYTVRNVGRHDGKYPIHTFVEKPASGSQSASFPNVELGLQKIIVDGEELRCDQIDEARKSVTDSTDYIQSSYSIELPSGSSKRVTGVHFVEKFERDSELWRSVIPCSGMNLIITWNECFDIAVKASAIHPADTADSKFEGFDSKSTDSNSLRASLFKPFFPFNGVYFWWDISPPAKADIEEDPKIGVIIANENPSHESTDVASGTKRDVNGS